MSYRMPLIAIALMATTTAVAAAQDQPRATAAPAASAQPRRMEGGGLNRLLQGITLTSQQRVTVDSIRSHHMAEMPQIPQGQRPDSAQRATARVHIEAMQRDIRAVLTPDQQSVWDKNVQAARAAMQAHRGEMH